ncbi:ribulose 1,5-bisphosphate carboxylase [Sphingomonas koreensis]|jgi:ribulose-bisphosphate carboxylase large chain|uniref:Ribulose 1,5-bisphosphate carboxylase n=1 Tax=Sphingomonas koreensis TaxID=93064 RepID=A0A1L6J5T1_9SPHN|nr:ribulose-bisphosphate carboxylase large subunit family protein [Sphingomonas koreensis]APR51265.1 ribulose 1,5-bisphosphate carboxylase [Sphingomonas koreensis]MDC7810405.1 ribulose-bisphosphate carboxylase large subunit family protein [Sphingomonas koreensis]RSU17554.1 ribulose 1,5-bisphosphate carboxylase [Sphingomonas koreensis]RSU21810.1 ribulose 1,5-bisphosphate carboxylase [Sphingomonas koreensis]RSU26178.1 ribulose 1,5-bisphosphate carboxylase [Sphingomonas koreensis]
MDRVTATYEIETAFPLRQAAETMAGEQSTGTFVRVPGETDALREAHAARVEELVELGEVAEPSLPGSGLPSNWDGKRRRARAVLSWPTANMGLSLPNLLATINGNLSELKAFSGLRLIDVTLPPAFLERYQGPQFGVAGTRELAGVHDRPIIGTIIKPSVGMSPEATAAQVRTLVEAGIDFIKDDELQADGPHCPFDERISAVMRVINDHADKTGKKVMFAANLTGEIDEMLARHDHVVAEGGTCIMASMNSIGLPAMKMLRAHSQLPIHGHRNGWGMLGRSPAIGMSYIAFQKLWRLAGIDHTHVNGIDNKFCESNESVIASARECLTPMFPAPHKGCEIMPVFSSGQSAKQAAPTYAALGSVDCMFAAGGGIMAHPGGPAAGVRALQQAWEAAVAGVPVEQAANDAPELKAALGAFGG